MKKSLLFIIYFFNCFFSFSQSLSPNVISSSGTSFNSGVNQLEWTLGESVIFTLSNGSNLLSQGFHQTNLLVSSLGDSSNDYIINVFPNPTFDYIQLQFEKINTPLVIELYSVEGKLLTRIEAPNNNSLLIDMNDYAAGIYMLYITNNYNRVKSCKVGKIN